MVKSSREDLPFEYSKENLKKMTSRIRSARPLVHEMISYTIAELKNRGLLNVGQTNRYVFDEQHSAVTTLGSKRTVLKIRIQKHELVIPLVSRRLGLGLVWYFKDPSSGRLVRTVYFSKKLRIVDRKTAGGLYASQFQSKCYRQILQMDKLICAIDGDWRDRREPARGKSKVDKLEKLARIFAEVREAERERNKILTKYPQLYLTICAANTLLKRELGKSHKNWAPSKPFNRRGHYSTNGLYAIPQ